MPLCDLEASQNAALILPNVSLDLCKSTAASLRYLSKKGAEKFFSAKTREPLITIKTFTSATMMLIQKGCVGGLQPDTVPSTSVGVPLRVVIKPLDIIFPFPLFCKHQLFFANCVCLHHFRTMSDMRPTKRSV